MPEVAALSLQHCVTEWALVSVETGENIVAKLNIQFFYGL